jgi:hypothetical protein
MITYYGIVLDEDGNTPSPEAEFILHMTCQGNIFADNIQIYRDAWSHIQFAAPGGSDVTLTINGTPHNWVAPLEDGVIPLSEVLQIGMFRAEVLEAPTVEPQNSAADPMSVTDAVMWFKCEPAYGLEIPNADVSLLSE